MNATASSLGRWSGPNGYELACKPPSLYLPYIHTYSSTYSAHSDRKENYLAVANLHNGVDIYILPTMQLVKTYNHGSVDTALYQVVFAGKDWVISGSEEGHTRVYERSSGVLQQRLDHCEGEFIIICWFTVTDMRPRESVAHSSGKMIYAALIWILNWCLLVPQEPWRPQWYACYHGHFHYQGLACRRRGICRPAPREQCHREISHP